MQFRSGGGVYIGQPAYSVEEFSDGWAVLVTRWYRRGDEKDFDVDTLSGGYPSRAHAEEALPKEPRKPCNLPGVGEATRALMNGAGHTPVQRKAAARVWLRHFGELTPSDPMRPIYDLAKSAQGAI